MFVDFCLLLWLLLLLSLYVLWFAGRELFFLYFLGSCFSSRAFGRAEFINRYCLSLIFIMGCLFPLHLSSFAGYNILGWHLWFCRICRTSVQALIDFKISIEKSGVSLIDLPLYLTCFSPFVAFNILSLCSTFNVLILIDVGFFSFLYFYYLKIWCLHNALDSLRVLC